MKRGKLLQLWKEHLETILHISPQTNAIPNHEIYN